MVQYSRWLRLWECDRIAIKLVEDVWEAYTTKTVSWTGEIVKIAGAQQIRSWIDGRVIDRDINGA